jgi:hypothetical protein
MANGSDAFMHMMHICMVLAALASSFAGVRKKTLPQEICRCCGYVLVYNMVVYMEPSAMPWRQQLQIYPKADSAAHRPRAGAGACVAA